MNQITRYIEQMPKELDAVLITNVVGRQYFTGMRSTAGTVLITRAGGYFLIDFRYVLTARQVVKSCEVILQENLYEQLATLMKKHQVQRLGIESGYMTLEEVALWKEKLPTITIDVGSAAGDAVRRLRMIKSADELDSIRAAQKIGEQAFTHILDFIQPGRTEREIACELEHVCALGGSEGPAFDTIVVSGEKSARPHGTPDDKRVAAGELITMDFGCIVNGYHSDMTRTVALGSASEQMRTVYDTVLRAQQAALDLIRPGVLGGAVDAAARELITAAGYGDYFGHGTGHSFGLEIHEAPRFSTADATPCAVDMVMSVEPGIYLEGQFGVRIEDIVRITENGYENMTTAPKQLIIL